MADFHVRLDDDVKARLEQAAREHGVSLNKYVGNVLADHAYNPSLKNIEDKYVNLAKDVVALYEQTLAKTNEALRENTYLMKKIMNKVGGDE